MKNWRKLVTLGLALIVLVGFTSCGKDQKELDVSIKENISSSDTNSATKANRTYITQRIITIVVTKQTVTYDVLGPSFNPDGMKLNSVFFAEVQIQ